MTTPAGGRVIVGHLKGERRRSGSGRVKQTVQAVLTPKGNPWLAVMNPGRAIGVGVREVVYEKHATRGRGPWRHVFKRGDVEVRGLPSGAAVIRTKGGAPVWSRDGKDAWLDNPGSGHKRPVGGFYKVTVTDKWGTGWAWVDATGKTRTEVVRQFSRHIGGRGPKRQVVVKWYPTAISNKGAPVARKRTSHRKTKRRPPRGFKTWAAYMASIRPNSPTRKPRRRRASTRKGAKMARHRSRARRHTTGRRRHSHRGIRRNPMTRGIGAALLDGAKGGALVVGGKIVARAVPQFIGVTPVGPLGLAVQTVAGGAGYLLLSRFGGRELARPFLYGVFANAFESIIRGANVPVLSPSLGDETELHALAGYVPAAVAAREARGIAGYVPERVGMGDADEPAGAPMLVMA